MDAWIKSGHDDWTIIGTGVYRPTNSCKNPVRSSVT
jgi:hypothetical protein